MKSSQNTFARVILGPAFTEPMVANATKDLSDEEAVDQAAEIQRVLSAAAAHLQELYREGSRKEHEDSNERKLVVEHGAEVCRAIQSAIAAKTPLDDNTINLARRILCASELIIYPCWEFSETLSAREIVAFGKPLVDEIDPDKPIPLDREFLDRLRALMRDDIFALRMTTDEYHEQTRIFDLLRQYCQTLTAKMKEIGVREASILGLGLVQILDKRTKDWHECLSEEDAAEFAEGLKAFLDRFTREQADAKR